MDRIIYIGNQLAARGGTPTSIDTLAPLLREEGFEVKTASGKRNKFLRLLDMLSLVFRNRKNTNYVLIDTYSTQNFWYAYAVARLCQKLKLDYIPILHGGALPERLSRSRKSAERIFKKAYLNIAPSLYLKTLFQQEGIVNIKYIPNSIALEEYQFKERSSFSPRLLWVRAFAEVYDPMLAIKVLELLLPEYPEAKLCMIGPKKDSSYETCLRYARSKNLPVSFPGSLPKPEWVRRAANYDIFLNTTSVDNMPVSLIEAMALGLPVVSTRVGGIPYLISADIDGVLVPPGDPGQMAAAIHKILEDPDRAVQRTRAARKKVENFDWERVKKEWTFLLAKRDNEING